MEESLNHPVLRHPNDDVSEIANIVFGIDLIRETILTYAIADTKDKRISNISSLRLVNKTFFGSTLSILRRSQQSLFRFHLSAQGFTVGKEWALKSKSLSHFLVSLRGEDSGVEHVPPHSIVVSDDLLYQEDHQNDFFRLRNHRNFLYYLVTCGSSLIELTLTIDFEIDNKLANDPTIRPIYNDVNDAILPLTTNFQLPMLKTFKVEFVPGSIRNSNDRIIEDKFQFIQRVLEASTTLKSLVLSCTTADYFAPNNFGSTRLSCCITEIEFHCSLAGNSLEPLANNPLPKLKVLKLCVNNTPFKYGLVSRILKNVQKTLQTCHFMEGNQESGNKNKSPTKFQLPLMEKLHDLKIETADLQLEGHLSSLQQRTPLLKHITLTSKISSFRKWTDQSCFLSVETLCVSFVGENYYFNYGGARFHERTLVNLELATVKALASAFPNLQALDISFLVRGRQLSALVPILKEMKNLRQLRFFVEDYGQLRNSNAWESLFLGVPVANVAELKKCPHRLKQLKPKDGASILDLSELHTLELDSIYLHNFSIISEVVFRLAFLEMPKLTKLILKGGFFTTDQMKKEWRKKGGLIK